MVGTGVVTLGMCGQAMDVEDSDEEDLHDDGETLEEAEQGLKESNRRHADAQAEVSRHCPAQAAVVGRDRRWLPWRGERKDLKMGSMVQRSVFTKL
jgi:hypothetical protein